MSDIADTIISIVKSIKNAKRKFTFSKSVNKKNKSNLTNLRQNKFRPDAFVSKGERYGINKRKAYFDYAGNFNEDDF
jgi:hypothetical protein